MNSSSRSLAPLLARVCSVLVLLVLFACGGGRSEHVDTVARSAETESVESVSPEERKKALERLALHFSGDKSQLQIDSSQTKENPKWVKPKSSGFSPKAAYRFYNTATGVHFYTLSEQERLWVQGNLPNYKYEGPAFFAASGVGDGLSPVYRFFNRIAGVHFYTINKEERDVIISKLSDIYSYDGIAWYASQGSGPGWRPIYRLFNKQTGAHFFTANPSEMLLTKADAARFVYEGIAYYVRLTNLMEESVVGVDNNRNGVHDSAEHVMRFVSSNDEVFLKNLEVLKSYEQILQAPIQMTRVAALDMYSVIVCKQLDAGINQFERSSNGLVDIMFDTDIRRQKYDQFLAVLGYSYVADELPQCTSAKRSAAAGVVRSSSGYYTDASKTQRVIYINGIRTSDSAAFIAQENLQAAMGFNPAESNWDYSTLHNVPHGPIDDNDEMKWQATYSKRAADSLATSLQTVASLSTSEKVPYYRALGNVYNTISSDERSKDPQIDTVFQTAAHLSSIVEARLKLSSAHKVILVPHSQGNFFVEAAIGILLDRIQKGQATGLTDQDVVSRVKVVGVAPVAATSWSNSYVNSDLDLTVNTSLLMGPVGNVAGYMPIAVNYYLCGGKPCDASLSKEQRRRDSLENGMDSKLIGPFEGHGILETYLNHRLYPVIGTDLATRWPGKSSRQVIASLVREMVQMPPGDVPIVTSITGHSPTAVQASKQTIFVYQGSNLGASLSVVLAGCDTYVDLGGDTTQRRFSCIPRASGLQSLTIKDSLSGNVLYVGTVNVAPAVTGPYVSGHSPSTATLGKSTVFTYTGTSLTSGMGFTVTNCDTAIDLGGSTTSRSFSCIPRTSGFQTLSISSVPGASVLYSGSVTVVVSGAGASVNSHAPGVAVLNQRTVFTYEGANLTSGMGFTVTGCDTTTDLGGSATSRSFSCIPRTSGAQTLTIKTAPGGSVLYNGNVTVSGPAPFVNSHSPGTATLNQTTVFTYSGGNLTSGMGFTVTGCDTTTDLGGSATSRSFSCIPRTSGAQTLTIKTAPGGSVLYNGNVTVSGPAPFVNSHSPGTATLNQTTVFTYSGGNLTSGMGFTVTGCDTTTDRGGSATSRSFSCIPRTSGAQTLTIKTAPGGSVLYNGNVTVSGPAPFVNSHSPGTATLNQTTVFTYSGGNLTSGMGFTVTGCDTTTDLGGSATSRSFSCIPRTSGAQTLTIKTAPGGSVLYNGNVTVSGPAPFVNSHSPGTATLNQTTVFTYSGGNLTSGMGFTVTGCDTTTDRGGSATSRSFSCIPRTSGAQTLTIKTAPGGSVLYNGNVTVSGPAPFVNSHSPGTATLNQTTVFTYSGGNLTSGMGFTVTGCDTTTDLGGSATSRSFSCIPRTSGAQTLTIKTAPGGSVLYNGNVTVSGPAPFVNSHSPGTATLNQTTVFTYSGGNLTSGMGFTVTGCDTTTDLGGSATSRSFSCIPRTSGAQTLTIKTAPGGSVLYNGNVTVSGPAPFVNSHSPGTATLNQTTVFTYSGGNLTSGMGFTVTGCDTTTDLGGSATSRSFSCIPRTSGAQTLTIKTAPGGSVLYNGNVTVSGPAPFVNSHSPGTATLNQTTVFTYSGGNLTSGMGFTVTNCDNTIDRGGSTTSRSFSCIPRLRGAQTLTVKTAPGGSTLYGGNVNVQ